MPMDGWSITSIKLFSVGIGNLEEIVDLVSLKDDLRFNQRTDDIVITLEQTWRLKCLSQLIRVFLRIP